MKRTTWTSRLRTLGVNLGVILCATLSSSCFLGGDCTPIEPEAIATTDNGAWVVSANPPPADAIQLLDDQSGYLLGPAWGLYGAAASALRKTSDGGKTWTTLQAFIRAVYFRDANTGWAVGNDGLILKTVNGGAAWKAVASGIARDLAAVHFADAATGYAVGDGGTILKTGDGGKTWTVQASGRKTPLIAVHFTSAMAGVVVGDDGVLLRTTNGGARWIDQSVSRKYHLASVDFVGQTGWTVGNDGVMFKTTNGGGSWTGSHLRWVRPGLPDSIVDFYLTSVRFVDAKTGWVLGLTNPFSAAPAYGVLLKTLDGGATWTQQIRSTGDYSEFSALSVLDANNAWLTTAQNEVLVTQDGGQTWSVRATGLESSPRSLHFANASAGWSVGEDGSIFHTADGGAVWTVQRGVPEIMAAFQFVDSSMGWMVGEKGAIRKTVDGGETWTAQAGGTSADLFGLYFRDALAGYAVGKDGVAVKTADGGATWTPSASAGPSLRSVYFTDAQTGYAAGDAGTLLKTTNAGASWGSLNSGTSRNLTGVRFTDANHGFAVGGGTGEDSPLYTPETSRWSHGVILRTTDAGASWTAYDSAVTPLKLYAVTFTDAATGYAVGGGPASVSYPSIGMYDSYCRDSRASYYTQILKTTDGGVSWIPERTGSQQRIDLSYGLGGGNPLRSVSCSAGGACAAAGSQEILLRP